MDVARFKQVFDTLDEEGQKSVLSQLSDEELDAISQYKPAMPKQATAEQFQSLLGQPEQFSEGFNIGFGKGLTGLYSGAKEAFFGAGEKMGVVPGGTEQRMRAATDEENRVFSSSVAQEPESFRYGAGTGEVAGAVAPALVLPGGQSAAARIGLGTLYGAGFGAASHIPVNSDETRLGRTAKGAATGFLISGGLEAANRANPRNLLTRFIQRRTSTPIGEEGKLLEAKTGIPMTFGEKSGDPFLSSLEQQLPQTTGTISARNKQLHTAVKNLTRTLNVSEKNPVKFATKAKDALDDTVGLAEARRSAIAARDYGKFKELFGEEKAIMTSSTLDELAKIADEYSVGASQMGRQSKTIANQLAKLADDNGNINVNQFLNLRSRMSGVMAGKGNLFKDIDRSLDVKLAGRIMDALNRDVQGTAVSIAAKGNKPASELLTKAVKNYQKNSQVINDIESSAFGKIFKSDTFTPETAAKSIVNMQPSEVRSAFSILGRRNKETAELIKAHYIRDAIRGSMKGPEALATQSRVNPGELVKNLTSHGGTEKLRAMFPDKREFEQVLNSVRSLERLADTVGATSGANQAAVSRSAEVARNVAGGPSLFWAGTLAKIAAPIGLRKALMTEAGRRNLQILTNPVSNQAAIIKAAQFFEEELKEDTGE